MTTIFPQDSGLAMIYGSEEGLKASRGAEQVLGYLPRAVEFIAAAESSEVIKILLGQNHHLLRNQMLFVDMATNTYETVRLT